MQNMYTLTKIQRGNVNGNVHGNLPKNMGACMGTRLGTWERGRELNWERQYVKYGREWGTSLGMRAHGWDITFANVHHLHTILVIFINSCLCTTLHNTYVECPTAHD
jgi:hypothetical protein